MKPYSKVMVAIPTRSHIQIGLLTALIDWIQNGAALVLETAILIDNARNKLTRVFLNSDKDYLLFVDSDIAPPPEALQRLIDHDKDVITGYHNVVHEYKDGLPVIIPSSSEVLEVNADNTINRKLCERNKGLVQVQGAATSFMLIKRKVFKDWKRPWFKMLWNEEHTNFIGEDYWFCIEARKRGFEVWTDTDLEVKHVKEMML